MISMQLIIWANPLLKSHLRKIMNYNNRGKLINFCRTSSAWRIKPTRLTNIWTHCKASMRVLWSKVSWLERSMNLLKLMQKNWIKTIWVTALLLSHTLMKLEWCFTRMILPLLIITESKLISSKMSITEILIRLILCKSSKTMQRW